MVKVIWTDNAIVNVYEIRNYIVKNSELYAAITDQKLFEAVEILERHPKPVEWFQKFENETLRELSRRIAGM